MCLIRECVSAYTSTAPPFCVLACLLELYLSTFSLLNSQLHLRHTLDKSLVTVSGPNWVCLKCLSDCPFVVYTLSPLVKIVGWTSIQHLFWIFYNDWQALRFPAIWWVLCTKRWGTTFSSSSPKRYERVRVPVLVLFHRRHSLVSVQSGSLWCLDTCRYYWAHILYTQMFFS